MSCFIVRRVPRFHGRGVDEYWFIRGVHVPRKAVREPHKLSIAEILKEPDVEVRRIMIERYGSERLIRQAGAIVDQSQTGVLFSVRLAGDEALMMLQVTDPSTGRQYHLRVPPVMRTARQAVAWTFNMREEEYHPMVET